MVSVLSLWLPILLSAVVVFVASSIIHMALGYHAGDYRRLANENEVQEAFRTLKIAPGDYALPCAKSMGDMKNPEFLAKMNKGPVVTMTVTAGGPPSMGASLVQWFFYSLLVGVFAAYITGRALTPGAHYLSVFRFAGTTAFLGYSMALLQHSIWYKRSWRTTLVSMFDGLVYAALTAGTFGWLWP
jgi:hypothetical protein